MKKHRWKTVAMCLALVLTSIQVPAVAGIMDGSVSASAGANGKIEAATFTYTVEGERVEVSVFLDKMGLKLAREGPGEEVQVSGSIFTKKKVTWIKVKSFAMIFTGTLTATRDAKKKISSVTLNGSGSAQGLAVELSNSVRKIVEKADANATYRIVGCVVVSKKGDRLLKIKSIGEILTFRGDLKAVVDKKGKVRSAKLTVAQGKKKAVYGIQLDAKGIEVAQNHTGESVEIKGMLNGKKIRVLGYQKD